jgi:23S rRNA pseudouridine1911/1915/1917 synthase
MMVSAPMNLKILFEDDHVIAVVKPAGLATANVPAGTPSLFALVRSRLPRGSFVGVVSRLDAPVSGVVVLAKNRAAAADVSDQFRHRTVRKSYVALCGGRFPAPLGRWVDWHDTIERPADSRRDEAGAVRQAAHVRARVVRRGGEVSLVELEPSSGRRHQLRAQLGGRGCPIVGDRLYGSRLPFPTGIALHAKSLEFDHPATGNRIRLEAALPSCWSTRYPLLFGRQLG